MAISIPNTFSPGTTIQSSQVNANLSEIATKALDKTGDTLTGNLTVSGGVTIDGRDLSADLDQAVKTTSSPSFAGLSVTATAPAAAAGYKERSRSDALGEWISAYTADGNFTSDVGSWTVAAAGGDVTTYVYTLIGKTMILAFWIQTSTVAGTPAQLRIAVPGGHTIFRNWTAVAWGQDGATEMVVQVNAEHGLTYLKLFPTPGQATWSNATNTTAVQGQIAFEIA
jgi:hypothetical protein